MCHFRLVFYLLNLFPWILVLTSFYAASRQAYALYRIPGDFPDCCRNEQTSAADIKGSAAEVVLTLC